MATFTKIAESEPHVISINPAHKVSKIDDNTYGGFTECVPFVGSRGGRMIRSGTNSRD